MAHIYNVKVQGSPMKTIESDVALSANELRTRSGLNDSYAVTVGGSVVTGSDLDSSIDEESVLVVFAAQVKGA